MLLDHADKNALGQCTENIRALTTSIFRGVAKVKATARLSASMQL